jgi:hypothetical protein
MIIDEIIMKWNEIKEGTDREKPYKLIFFSQLLFSIADDDVAVAK